MGSQVITLTHVAAPIDADQVQRCARCRAVLKDFRPGATFSDGAYGVVYPKGAEIEVGMLLRDDGTSAHFQSIVLGGTRPQCAAVEIIDTLTYASYRANRERSPLV